MESYDLLKKKVEEAADDIAKASGGNKAASTRVRKAMQDIKAQAQEIRIKVLEISRQPPAAGWFQRYLRCVEVEALCVLGFICQPQIRCYLT